MIRSGFLSKLLFLLLLIGLSETKLAKAEHIVGGDIYWECVTTGPDAGKFIFYLTLYRDCSVQNTIISSTGHVLQMPNHPTITGDIPLTLISQTDITQPGCGISCASANPGDVSTEQFLFATAPVTVSGTPPAEGFLIRYHRCCRNGVDNLVDAGTQEIYYTATMYPFNGQDVFPCFDSSPQFAESPTSLLCSGYELRYNSNAIDSDLDSLSYELVEALGNFGAPVPYTAGYSPTTPLPGPTLDPSYDQVTLDPVTGQLEYDGPGGVQGRWTVVAAVYGWRCGQLISKTIREMSVTIIPCLEPNTVPQVAAPTWVSPGTASGYEVTVLAGDLVNFSLTGIDNDITGGNPQVIEFTASGSQFGTNYTNAAAGCLNPPCATLSAVSPPATGVGSISTTFNWQTSCDHVAVSDACANLSNTYNFIFTYRDDFCPARATNMVNVTVTVLGEPIVESPDPHCVSVAANGDVTLYWAPSADPAVPPSFVEYVIYHSTSPNGPFGQAQEVATVGNINTNTYTHTAANPVSAPSTTGPNYYLIRTRSGCNDAVLDAPIDTISSIFLTLNNTGTTANLSWNAVTSPALSTSGQYEVWREYPAGNWMVIGSTSSLSYVDPIIWCNEQVNYRIELPDNLPCVSVSNVVGDILNNPAQPDPQPIDSVTVVGGLARISWLPNTQVNVVEYTIEQNNLVSGIWTPLFTALGYNNTDWTNPNSIASTESEYYRVKATNNCQITGSPVDYHRTIFAGAIADGCAKIGTIDWNEYLNWPEGVREYEIYVSKDAGPTELIGTAADTIFTFDHTGLEDEATYCYTVVAVRNTANRITSTSNDTCVYVYVPKRPEYDYNYNTTVQPGNTGIEEFFFCDSTAGYIGFDIQRGVNLSSMSTIWFTGFDQSTRFYQFTDPGAQPGFKSYYYQIIGVDSCDLPADTLNISRTIFLQAEANSDRTNSLEWNAYEGWIGDVAAYNIYRSIDGPFEYLTTVPSGQLTFLDSIQEIIIGEGNFCYYIEAVQGIGAPVGPVVAPPEPILFQELSRSNEDCARQHPNVFMPNAFMPEGVNNLFKPITVYVEANTYLFQIYNRWGQKLFETNNPNDGWNGTHGGKADPQGAYVYFVQFVSSNGETYSKSGSVTLIR